MVKYRKGNLILLGLSRNNVERMEKDFPVIFNGESLGIDATITIWFGENEMAILNKMVENDLLRQKDLDEILGHESGGNS